jgi:hypothetical protein
MAIEAMPVYIELRRGVHPVPDALSDIALYPVRITGNAVIVYDRTADGTLRAAGTYPTGGWRDAGR